jgi:hypothetical protein
VEKGIYVVRLFRNRTWVNVIVDDLIPCSPSGRPIFASNKTGNEFWVSIIEKAYAKICGSYRAIESGNEAEGLVDLSGGIALTLMLHEGKDGKMITPTNLWDLLSSYFAKGFFLGAANNRTFKIKGIEDNHAYGVLSFHTPPGCDRLVKLRNPWGCGEWEGAWGAQAPRRAQVSDATKKAIGFEKVEDGVFFMSIEDFFTTFDKVYLCRYIPSDWHEHVFRSAWSKALGTNGGCDNNGTWIRNPQLELIVPQKTRAVIVLTQGDCRKEGEYTQYETAISMFLYKNGESGRRTFELKSELLVERTQFVPLRDRVLNVSLSPEGSSYIIIPWAFSPNDEANFKVTFSLFSLFYLYN